MKKSIFCLLLVVAFADAVCKELGPIAWAVSERQGKRPTMEDDYAAVLNFKNNNNPNEAFFGIYDGHGGDQAAIATARGLPALTGRVAALHELIAQSSLLGKELYIHAYKQMDEAVRKHTSSGTTAVTAHITKNENGDPIVFLAWAGDARAVLVRQDGTVSQAGVTIDHKPDRADEKKRIEQDGGFVFFYGVPRVGGLAISRAIGDGEVKDASKGVVATPEVKAFNLLDRHHFLILACDGVWDVFSNEQAARIVRDALEHTGPVPVDPIAQTREQVTEAGNNDRVRYAARALRDAAKNANSTDNISVLVIELVQRFAKKT